MLNEETKRKLRIIEDLEKLLIDNKLFDVKKLSPKFNDRMRIKTIIIHNTYIKQEINVSMDSPQAMLKDVFKHIKYS